MRNVIIINGYPQSGKDTFANEVIDYLTNYDWSGANISSIKPVWEMLKAQGIPMDNKTPAERALAAEVKAALNRYNRFADRMACFTVVDSLAQNNSITFLHIREPDSIAYCRRTLAIYNNLEVKTLFIDRPGANKRMGNPVDEGVENYIYDFRITNSGSLNDFKAQAIEFAKKFVA
ncbi:deoxynucleoside monophosphate kinase [Rhizobium phage RHEph22]|uniref:Uncharacterized protein n=1 Tax=Rhizobium phage RHEph22 TaxID=2836135 RepID=A0AAE8AWP4_9CAUD|nr:deoxynucleoside monophosphate kinase [Rhizobium phage RHEph22]QXV74736.1 hypothetical protein [Rhizobium phage RHEph22]QXV74831.1 hypothetical protein [Rhizobium phage RHEph24]